MGYSIEKKAGKHRLMEMFHELEDHHQQQQDISQFLACSILDDLCLLLHLECFHTQTGGSMYCSFLLNVVSVYVYHPQ